MLIGSAMVAFPVVISKVLDSFSFRCSVLFFSSDFGMLKNTGFSDVTSVTDSSIFTTGLVVGAQCAKVKINIISITIVLADISAECWLIIRSL